MNAIQKSAFHFRYRWVGFPLLISGGCLFLFSLSAYRETQDWFVCLLGFGSAMLGLTSFGVNHDTAIAYALEADKEPDVDLSPNIRMEVDEDLDWDRASTLAIQSTPKTAIILPWAVIALQFYVFWRLMCVLSFPIVGKASICTLPVFDYRDSSVQAASLPLPEQTEEKTQETDVDDTNTNPIEESGLDGLDAND